VLHIQWQTNECKWTGAGKKRPVFKCQMMGPSVTFDILTIPLIRMTTKGK